MAFLLPVLPLFAYFGLLVLVVVLLAAAFWPLVLPRAAAFFARLQEAQEAKRRMRSTRLAKRVSRG